MARGTGAERRFGIEPKAVARALAPALVGGLAVRALDLHSADGMNFALSVSVVFGVVNILNFLLIAIPLGPEGGSGFIGDGVADSATIAELKGRHMLIDTYASLFDAAPRLAA